MNAMSDFDISQLLNIFYRKKGLIICVCVVVSLLAVYTATILTNIYQSTSLILVSPQKLPSSFVTSTITTDLAERMQSVIQEILSRTQLEKIVQEFDLYSAGKNTKEVMIFEHANYGGLSQTLQKGKYDTAQITIGNHTLTSALVPTGMVLRLYEHANFQGAFIDIRADTPAIYRIRPGWNDRASSIVVGEEAMPITSWMRVDLNLDERVEKLRKAVKVEFRRNNVFQLSYESNNPETAKQVTSRLASLFIEQNLQVREQQAMGTKSFMSAEADRLRKELEEQEVVVNQYKAANRYELPDQQDSNLRTLEQLRREMEAGNQRLTALQERKGILQKQTVESDILGVDLLGGALTGPAETGTQGVQVQMRKKELDSLLQRYSNKHPDVVRIKKEIDGLEAEGRGVSDNQPASSTSVSSNNPLKRVLQTQITDIDAEIQTLRSQRDHIRNQISTLQSRVDASPIRAIELSKISRGYEITLRKYQDLLAKSLESDLSENMEKKQKGERFEILDPANLPLKPVRPNRPMIILMGFLIGLGGGFGLAFVWDNFDTSFKRSDEISAYVDVPLLATIPALMTRGSVIEQRRSQGVLVLASLGVLLVGMVCLRMFGPIYF